MAITKTNEPPNPIIVALYEAKPNKMFTAEHTARVRFLRYSQPVPCAECGRKSKTHWTVLYSFKALSLAMIVPQESDKVHMPLTPVCRAHILKPAGYVPGSTITGRQPAQSDRTAAVQSKKETP